MSTLPLFDDPRGRGPAGKGKPPDDGDDTRVYRVSQLNRAVRGLLEQRWGSVWVHGEISDFSLPASGHAYFTLNDEDEPAQLRVVLFRSDVQRSKARLANGARVRLQGQLSLFSPRGSFQMIARIALPEGLGELHAQFERVRKKLDAEGLLAPERKRALPHLPRVLGVVTSLHGAALHDIIRVVQARSPTRIVISPCSVQGATAPGSIIRALHRIQQLRGLDALIIGRGGGSAEDLIAFNDERVARAIASCRVPVISAVGHEVDITIADLVADVRAATPSNAAELAVPDRRALLSELLAGQRRLAHAAEIYLGRARLRIANSSRRLRDPRQVLRHNRARLQTLEQRLNTLLRGRLREARTQLKQHESRLAKSDPQKALRRTRLQLSAAEDRLLGLTRGRLRTSRSQLQQLHVQLNKRDPRQVLRHTRTRFKALEQRLHTLLRGRLRTERAQLAKQSARLASCDPQKVVRQRRVQLKAQEQRLHGLMRARLRTERAELASQAALLTRYDLRLLLAARRQRLSQLHSRLVALGRALSHRHRQRIASFAGQLTALSPLASLARGYAIVLHEPSGRALLRASDARIGDGLQIRLHDGSLRARVETS
jgi:exodeoxyribonuclease VII large subunit